APSSTTHTDSLSAFGCGLHSITCPTTTPSRAGPAGRTSSTSSPAVVSSSARLAPSPSTTTHSRSHSRLMRTVPLPELLEEAQIVLEEQPQVVHPVAQHREPLDAHAERIAAVLLRIDAHVVQDVRMHHAAAEDLEPAAGLRPDIDLGRRLREREVRRTEAQLDLALEEARHELVQERLQVREADAAVDREPLDLREH